MQARSSQAGLLRVHALLIVSVMVLTTAGALVVAMLQPAPYVSVSRVVVQAEQMEGGGTPLAPDMGTEREIAVSGEVAQTAAEALNLTPGEALEYLQVEVPVETNVLEFSYSATTSERAVHGAEVFTEAYVDYRNGLDSSVAQIITPPSPPSEPTRPNFYLILGVSLLAGLGLGIGLAYAWERLSPWLRDVNDVESQTGLPVLAEVPTAHLDPEQRMVVGPDHAGDGAETYGHLAARLLSLCQQYDAHNVVVTSPTSGAGKTTVTLNLAASLAAAGQNVVALSADSRDEMRIRSGVARRPGLHELMRDKVKLEDALHDTEIDGLRILPPGGSMMAPRPALSLRRLTGVLDELREVADVVLIDAPSVLGGAHAAILAEQADLTLLVVDLRRGRRADVGAAVRALSHVESRLAGCVVNDPGRRPRKPEGSQPVPTFRLIPSNLKSRLKTRSAASEGKHDARVPAQSEDLDAIARLRRGSRSAGIEPPDRADDSDGTTGRVIDLP